MVQDRNQKCDLNVCFPRYKTDVHFLVARLTKFSMTTQKRPITLQHKIVKIHFTDCKKPKKYRHSNYRLVRTLTRPRPTLHQKLNIDIACKNDNSSFIVYGYVGEMGPHGESITVWADNHRVSSVIPIHSNSSSKTSPEHSRTGSVSSSGKTTPQNTTKIEIGSVKVSYKIHLLPTPIRIRTGEILEARCTYHDRSRYAATITPNRNPREELCKITLLTMIQHSSTAGPQTCSTPADFGAEDVTFGLPKLGIVEFLQAHPFVMMGFVSALLVIGLVVVRCRDRAGYSEPGQSRARMNTQEFQGLLNDFNDFDSDLKMK